MSYQPPCKSGDQQVPDSEQREVHSIRVTQPQYKKRIYKRRKRTDGRHRREVCQSLADLTTVSSLLKQQTQTLPFLELNQTPTPLLPLTAKPTLAPVDEIQPLKDYLSSIGEHLFAQEAKLPMPVTSFTLFFGPEQRMRSLQLIISFCKHFSFKTETIFMAFGIFQRLCVPQFQKYHLVLRTCTALFIAAKYEEIAVPRAEIFAKLDPQQTVQKQNLFRLESLVLLYFQFNLGFPSPLHFINLLTARYSLSTTIRNQMVGICQASIRSELLWQGPSSLLALACLQYVVPGLLQGDEGGPQLKRQLVWRCGELRRLGLQICQ